MHVTVCQNINVLTDRLTGKQRIKVKNINELKQSGPVCELPEQAFTQVLVEDVRV